MNEERELPSKVPIPGDWRDWINEFPSIKAVALTCVIAWIVTPLVMTIDGALIARGFVSDQKAMDGIAKLISVWLDALNWLTLAAVFGVVSKRATEKPEVIRAEGEVAAAQTVAKAKADVIATTGQIAVPDPHQAIIEKEIAEKKARQSGTEFESTVEDPG